MEISQALIEKSGRTREEIKELREIFNLVDSDGGGTISKMELAKLMKMVGVPANGADIDVDLNDVNLGNKVPLTKLLMTEMGGDSKEINFESFLLIVTKKVQTSITLKELKDAFAILDCYDALHGSDIFYDRWYYIYDYASASFYRIR